MSTRSFEKTTSNLHEVESAVGYHLSVVAQKLREKKLVASRLHILMQASRHGDFLLRKGSVEIVLPVPTASTKTLLKESLKQVQLLFDREVPYKKAGVVVSGLMPESYITGDLFGEDASESDTQKLDSVTDFINEKFGHGTIKSAVVLHSGARGSAKLRSHEYTTSWKDIPIVKAV